MYAEYPTFRALFNPRRFIIFDYGDEDKLFGVLRRTVILCLLVWLFLSPWLILAPLVVGYLQILDIHKHAHNPWYYPIEKSIEHMPAYLGPDASALSSLSLPEIFPIEKTLEQQHYSRWDAIKAWFNREASFGIAPLQRNFAIPLSSSRNARNTRNTRAIHDWDAPLWGTPLSVFVAWLFAGMVPTGRQIVNFLAKNKILPSAFSKININRASPRYAFMDFLPWLTKPDDFTIRTKKNHYMRSWRVSGYTTMGEGLEQIKSRIDANLASLPDGTCIHACVHMLPGDKTIIPRKYAVEAATLIAEEQRLRIEQSPIIKTLVDIHLTYIPEKAHVTIPKMASFSEVSMWHYSRFVGIATSFEDALGHGAWSNVVPLGRNELKKDTQFESLNLYLEDTDTPAAASIRAYPPDTNISTLLGRHNLSVEVDVDGNSTGVLRVDEHLVSILDIYNIRKDSLAPDPLRGIEGHLPPIHYVLRWIKASRDESGREITKQFKLNMQNTSKVQGIDQKIDMPNIIARDNASESILADSLLQRNHAAFGWLSIGIVIKESLRGKTYQEALFAITKRRNEMQGTLEAQGFNVLDAMQPGYELSSYLGYMPGNTKDNVVRNLAPSGLVANLLTSYAPWPGSKVIVDPDKNYVDIDNKPVPSLLTTIGLDRQRFDWNPQNGKRGGHTLLTADPGGGKSSFLAQLITAYLSYDTMLEYGARVVLLDRDGSQKIHAALHHAQFLVCGKESQIGFGVFRNVHTEHGYEIAKETLYAMLKARNYVYNEETQADVEVILAYLRALPIEERDGDAACVASAIPIKMKNALSRYRELECGKLFSGSGEEAFSAPYTYVDIAPAFNSTELRMPVILSLMHAIESAAEKNGPMLLVAEEFWELLQDERLASIFVGWLKRLRKFGVWIFLVTHSIADFEHLGAKQSQIADALSNYIFLPSSRYNSEENIQRLNEIGISREEIDYLVSAAPIEGKNATPIAQIIQGKNKRVIPLHMGPISLALLGSTSDSARKRFAKILVQTGGDPSEALLLWVQQSGTRHVEYWLAYTKEAIQTYKMLRQQYGVQQPYYDPRLFDSSINDIDRNGQPFLLEDAEEALL